MEVCQLAIFPHLGFERSSCEMGGKSLSPDVSACMSSEEHCLLGREDHLVFGLTEVAVEAAKDGFTLAWDAGVKGTCCRNGEYGPNKRE